MSVRMHVCMYVCMYVCIHVTLNCVWIYYILESLHAKCMKMKQQERSTRKEQLEGTLEIPIEIPSFWRNDKKEPPEGSTLRERWKFLKQTLNQDIGLVGCWPGGVGSLCGHREISLWPPRDLSVAAERSLCGHREISLWPLWQKDVHILSAIFLSARARSQLAT